VVESVQGAVLAEDLEAAAGKEMAALRSTPPLVEVVARDEAAWRSFCVGMTMALVVLSPVASQKHLFAIAYLLWLTELP